MMTDLEFYHSRVGGQTIGDFVRAVLTIDNEQDAARFFRGTVAYIQDQIDAGTWKSRSTAEEAARSNIGWCYGEGMASKRIEMWVKACGASHPIFGLSWL